MIYELTLVGVHDRGGPNLERVVLSANAPTNMGQYGLIIGLSNQAQDIIPFRDNFFWFGPGNVNSGDWIFVYTGPGETRVSNVPNSLQKMYSVHWGRQETLFHHPDVIPAIVRLDAFQVPPPQLRLPRPEIATGTQRSGR